MKPTKTSEVTELPEVTNAPVPTDIPVPTSTPIPTNTPEPTKAPEVSENENTSVQGIPEATADGTVSADVTNSDNSNMVILDGSLFADGQEVQSSTGYILPDSDSKYYTETDLAHLSRKGLCYAKNEIYAKHHRKFQSPELVTYFMNTKWYSGDIESTDFTEELVKSVFNDYELENVKLLAKIEGGMGYYQLDQ